MGFCKICSDDNCKKHTFLIGTFRGSEFSGSSPPEVFVGRYNYPNINIGILSPQSYGNTSLMTSPEEWHKNNLGINQITALRNQLIYGRTKANIKKLEGRFLETLQEVAMTHRSVSASFKLKKRITKNYEKESRAPLISNAALVDRVKLDENPTIKRKVDYLVSDTDVKSQNAMLELEKSKIGSEQIIKLLSAGLLGLGKNRKLVPTRWSITAVDDTLSKNKLKLIKNYPEISDVMVFSSEYLGNHYEFILLPGIWSFEVIEISLSSKGVWQDYETFFPRKKYADSVTGAYYANRLAATEYLSRIGKQASVLVFREIRPEYDTPLGVGILREVSRAAFRSTPKSFNTLDEALSDVQTRLKQQVVNYVDKSLLLKDYGTQTKITQWF